MKFSKYFSAETGVGPESDEMNVFIDRGASFTYVTDEDGVSIYGDPAAFKALVDAVSTVLEEEA